MRALGLRKTKKILVVALAFISIFSAISYFSSDNVAKVSAAEDSVYGLDVDTRDSNYAASSGYTQTDNSFIRADMFLTAMFLSVIGFIVYIIKNRKHLMKPRLS